ncbi:MAG: TrkH family potassium uptake protein [Clostridium sp.]|nr:TrkH family potassium uptake protein [Clostridium sp.]MCI7443690.1 TrkH family potassium uptake protein [Clostridium sp.]
MKKSKTSQLSGVQILALGFAIVILVGAIILTLPISSKSGNFTNFLDSLFTATSAVCVTGLVTLDTGTYWNEFGQIVIMLLIEVGGLGFMAFTTLLAILLKRRITLRDRLIMQEAMNTFSIQGLVKMVERIVLFTILVQIIGGLLLATQFIKDYGPLKGLYFGIFHSVSAFCNAGFDLFGGYSSVTSYSSNAIVLLTLSIIIIVSGLGFTVIIELLKYKKDRRLSTHTKLVLLMTSILLFGGILFMFALEYNNPETLGPMSIKNKILNAIFAGVSPRTAGFNSISLDGMTSGGKFLTIILMYIGGSPGSTAGGLKTATFGIIVLTVVSVIKGREDTELFGRRLSKELVYRAFAILIISFSLVVVVTMLLCITQPKEQFIDLLYEATSAFATVGLTTGVTQRLNFIGKIIIMITMYFGRVGPLTVALALTNKRKSKGYRYPETKILIG